MIEKNIIIFARSKEPNGINELKYSLSNLYSKFLKADSIIDLIKIVFLKYKNINCIFCLTSIDLALCIWVLQILNKKIPSVLGVYHPKQIAVTLDNNYSLSESKLFFKIFAKLPLENIIFNSKACYESSINQYNFSGYNKYIIVCPSARQKSNHDLLKMKKKIFFSNQMINIITVSRYVDFKVCTIFSMIDVLDKLNEQGYNLHYHIYGSGHLKESLREKIKKSKFPENYILHGFLDPELFNQTIEKYDLFYGMGYALTNSAMLGIPSLIAIQDEKQSLTYGFFSEFNHVLTPMFGDKTKEYEPVSLESKLVIFLELNLKQRKKLGMDCRKAWSEVFDSDIALPKMLQVLDNAKYVDYEKISFLEILKIRLEKYWCRLINKPRFDL